MIYLTTLSLATFKLFATGTYTHRGVGRIFNLGGRITCLY